MNRWINESMNQWIDESIHQPINQFILDRESCAPVARTHREMQNSMQWNRDRERNEQALAWGSDIASAGVAQRGVQPSRAVPQKEYAGKSRALFRADWQWNRETEREQRTRIGLGQTHRVCGKRCHTILFVAIRVSLGRKSLLARKKWVELPMCMSCIVCDEAKLMTSRKEPRSLPKISVSLLSTFKAVCFGVHK